MQVTPSPPKMKEFQLPEFIQPSQKNNPQKSQHSVSLAEYLCTTTSNNKNHLIQVNHASELLQSLDYAKELLQFLPTDNNKHILWIDLEINPTNDELICGAMLIDKFYWLFNQQQFNHQVNDIFQLLNKFQFLGGHNLIEFDLPKLKDLLLQSNMLSHDSKKQLTDTNILQNWQAKTWDTLILSSLFIPHQPSHALAKLYKEHSHYNDPVQDCLESRCIFELSTQIWHNIPPAIQHVFHNLLFNLKILADKQNCFSLNKDHNSDNIEEIFNHLPDGNQQQLAQLIKEKINQSTIENDLWHNLGLACFISWLRYFDKPQARRPVWISKNPHFRQEFIQAENAFWSMEDPSIEWINQQANEFFEFEKLHDGQMSIVQAVLQNKDIPLGILQTGGGKSLTFQLPALIFSRYQRQLTVIISPLKALIENQVANLHSHFSNHPTLSSYQDRIAYLTSNQEPEEQQQILTGIWQGDIDIIYLSPERLRLKGIRKLFRNRPPAFWVLDEAHTLSQWGTDFRPDFLRIADHIIECYNEQDKQHILQNLTHLDNSQLDFSKSDSDFIAPKVSLVTATASVKVKNDLEKELINKLTALTDNKPLVQYGINDDELKIWRDEIQTDFRLVHKEQRKAEIFKILSQRKQWYEENYPNQPKKSVALVYLRNRKACEEYVYEFVKHGLVAKAYHSRIDNKQQVLDDFKNDKLDVVVCTNAFGMGIDKEGIHTVIHSGPPNNLESYIQEIGRIARKDYEKNNLNFGKAYMLWSIGDIEFLFKQERDSRIPNSRTLHDCWREIKPILNKGLEEQWFASSHLQPILQIGDTEQLNTQIRVALLALERYGLLAEEEQQPAYISIKLLDKKPNPNSESVKLYQLYQQIEQIADSDNIATNNQYDSANLAKNYRYHLPELASALGYSVKNLLSNLRQLVKKGYAIWQVNVSIRLPLTKKNQPYRHATLRQRLDRAEDAIQAMQQCIDSHEFQLNQQDFHDELDGFQRIDTRHIDNWLQKNSYNFKSRKVLQTLEILDIIKTRRSDNSTFVSSVDSTKIWLSSNNKRDDWHSWLQIAREKIKQLTILQELVLNKFTDNGTDKDNYQQFNIEQLANTFAEKISNKNNQLAKIEITPNQLLSQLNQLKKLKIIELSRLDDEADNIFFIKKNNKRTNYDEVAYKDLKTHYQDRCQRIHLLYHWLQESHEVQKAMIKDYFRLSVAEVCDKYLTIADPSSPYIKDYKKEILADYFNDTQRQIVQETSRASMILAGAGSGKTTIVVHRVAYLLIVEEIKPEKILVLAYNRLAVLELRTRLSALVGSLAHGVMIKTFHGLAREITGLSEKDAPKEDLQRICQETAHVDSYENARYHWIIEKAIAQAGEQSLYYQYIMVDEFQDIDAFQYQLIGQLANFHKNIDLDDSEEETEQTGYLMVVGDDDQNLYDFRGASIEYIQKFEQEYQLETGKKYYLLNNYRSADNIVHLANAFIEQALLPHERLKDSQHRVQPMHAYANSPIRFGRYQQNKGIDMASWLAQDIEQKRQDKPKAQIAVLAPRWQCFDSVQHYLEQANISCQRFNEKDDFIPVNSMIGQSLKQYLANNSLQTITGLAVEFLEDWRQKNQFNHLDMAWQAILQAVKDMANCNYEQVLQAIEIAQYTQSSQVMLISYHSAKGLEFDHVYVLDEYRSKDDIRPLYVALTRAKQTLTILQNQHYHSHVLTNILTDNDIQQRQDIQPITIPVVDNLPKWLEFHRFLQLEEIYLTAKDIVSEEGRNFIENTFVKDSWTQNKDEFPSHHFIYQTDSGLKGFYTKNNKLITPFSIKLYSATIDLQMVGYTTYLYQQNDLSWYEKANYKGIETSHYLIVPLVKFSIELKS